MKLNPLPVPVARMKMRTRMKLWNLAFRTRKRNHPSLEV
jgi:hypothetical protein